jgi:hypothetical protein
MSAPTKSTIIRSIKAEFVNEANRFSKTLIDYFTVLAIGEDADAWQRLKNYDNERTTTVPSNDIGTELPEGSSRGTDGASHSRRHKPQKTE